VIRGMMKELRSTDRYSGLIPLHFQRSVSAMKSSQ